MPYIKHTFLPGGELSSTAMTEMDDQIFAVTNLAETFTAEMVRSEIRKLSLTSDGDTVVLLYNGIEIGSASVGDLSSLIPCEGLTVQSTSPVELETGETMQIQYTVTPSNANQMVRFRSADNTICSVVSNGTITGVSAGRTTVSVLCGRFTVTLTVNIIEYLQPDCRLGSWISQNITDTSGRVGVMCLEDRATRYITFPWQRDGIFLKAGQRITVTTQPNANLGIWPTAQQYITVAPGPGGIVGSQSGSEYPLIVNCTVIDSAEFTGDAGKNFSYTATQDCYFIASFYMAAGCDTLADAVEAGYYTFRVDVPAVGGA